MSFAIKGKLWSFKEVVFHGVYSRIKEMGEVWRFFGECEIGKKHFGGDVYIFVIF